MNESSFIYYDFKRGRFLVNDQKISVGSSFSTRLLLYSLLNTRKYSRGSLLDIGCGRKPYQSLFQIENYTGIDYPSPKQKFSVEAFADAQALPFSSHSFDTILCTELLEHLRFPAKALSEIKRVLKPGGYVILSAPFFHPHHEVPRDYFRFTFYGLNDLVNNCGLTTIEIYGRGGIGSVIIDITSRLIASKLKALIRKFHLPLSLQNGLIRIVIQVPQRIAATIVLNSINLKKNNNLLFSGPPAFSLGFTLVAQNSKDNKE